MRVCSSSLLYNGHVGLAGKPLDQERVEEEEEQQQKFNRVLNA